MLTHIPAAIWCHNEFKHMENWWRISARRIGSILVNRLPSILRHAINWTGVNCRLDNAKKIRMECDTKHKHFFKQKALKMSTKRWKCPQIVDYLRYTVKNLSARYFPVINTCVTTCPLDKMSEGIELVSQCGAKAQNTLARDKMATILATFSNSFLSEKNVL